MLPAENEQQHFFMCMWRSLDMYSGHEAICIDLEHSVSVLYPVCRFECSHHNTASVNPQSKYYREQSDWLQGTVLGRGEAKTTEMWGNNARFDMHIKFTLVCINCEQAAKVYQVSHLITPTDVIYPHMWTNNVTQGIGGSWLPVFWVRIRSEISDRDAQILRTTLEVCLLLPYTVDPKRSALYPPF